MSNVETEVKIGGYHPFEFKQLVDTAFGVPEFDIINYRLIHTLFHIFAEEIAIRASGVVLTNKFDDLKVIQGEEISITDHPPADAFEKVILVSSNNVIKTRTNITDKRTKTKGVNHIIKNDAIKSENLKDVVREIGDKMEHKDKPPTQYRRHGKTMNDEDIQILAKMYNPDKTATVEDLDLRVRGLEQALEKLTEALELCCNKVEPEEPGETPIQRLENEMNDKLNFMQNELMAALRDIQNQICKQEQQLAGIMNNIQDIFGCLEDHFNKIESVEKQLESLLNKFMCVQSDVNSLLRERKCRERQIEEIIEQLEAIKVMKANKDSMMRMLDLKEDKTVVRTKLDANIFNCYQKEFSANLKVIHEKFIFLKEDIRNEVDPILTTLDTKASKMDICGLKEIIEMQINSANDQIESIVRLRMNPEGPITAEKYARSVNCTVCEDNVLMKTTLDGQNIPKKEEVLLKLARPVVNSRAKKDSERINYRNCGGKGTITNATDRIIRRGHFLKQFNVQPINKEPHYMEGDDGCVYRASPPKWPCDRFMHVKDGIKAGH